MERGIGASLIASQVILLLRCNWVPEFEWHSNLGPLGENMIILLVSGSSLALFSLLRSCRVENGHLMLRHVAYFTNSHKVTRCCCCLQFSHIIHWQTEPCSLTIDFAQTCKWLTACCVDLFSWLPLGWVMSRPF